jgi:hypothetical protein
MSRYGVTVEFVAVLEGCKGGRKEKILTTVFGAKSVRLMRTENHRIVQEILNKSKNLTGNYVIILIS